jgi:hypothetical protein
MVGRHCTAQPVHKIIMPHQDCTGIIPDFRLVLAHPQQLWQHIERRSPFSGDGK